METNEWLTRVTGSKDEQEQNPCGFPFLKHKVNNKDTLTSLALKYSVAVTDIKRSNGFLSDTDLYAKKEIFIPTRPLPIGPDAQRVVAEVLAGSGRDPVLNADNFGRPAASAMARAACALKIGPADAPSPVFYSLSLSNSLTSSSYFPLDQGYIPWELPLRASSSCSLNEIELSSICPGSRYNDSSDASPSAPSINLRASRVHDPTFTSSLRSEGVSSTSYHATIYPSYGDAGGGGGGGGGKFMNRNLRHRSTATRVDDWNSSSTSYNSSSDANNYNLFSNRIKRSFQEGEEESTVSTLPHHHDRTSPSFSSSSQPKRVDNSRPFFSSSTFSTLTTSTPAMASVLWSQVSSAISPLVGQRERGRARWGGFGGEKMRERHQDESSTKHSSAFSWFSESVSVVLRHRGQGKEGRREREGREETGKCESTSKSYLGSTSSSSSSLSECTCTLISNKRNEEEKWIGVGQLRGEGGGEWEEEYGRKRGGRGENEEERRERKKGDGQGKDWTHFTYPFGNGEGRERNCKTEREGEEKREGKSSKDNDGNGYCARGNNNYSEWETMSKEKGMLPNLLLPFIPVSTNSYEKWD